MVAPIKGTLVLSSITVSTKEKNFVKKKLSKGISKAKKVEIRCIMETIFPLRYCLVFHNDKTNLHKKHPEVPLYHQILNDTKNKRNIH
jgi:hypothetical protein